MINPLPFFSSTRRHLWLPALVLAPSLSFAQFTTPHVIATAADVTTTLGGTTFVNHGLVGVGRISASAFDSFGETFGSVSGLQITNWKGSAGGAYTGTFNILPDRGYNNNNAGGFFSNYAARVQQVSFSFTPYTGASNIGGSDIASQIAAQTQISFTSAISGVKFTYTDPNTGAGATTTGLDPGATGHATIFGTTVPYVIDYTGQPTPGAANQTFTNINKLAIDAEGLVLKADGSGYVSDEYGANVYYFNASKEIVGVIVPPAAVQPHTAGALNFISTVAADDGRRNNQGIEGVALSPDGKKLFTLLQSATVQDSGTPQQNRLYTRLAVYDVSSTATPDAPVAEYVLKLPTYTGNGGGGSVNFTAAQSEIIALDDHRILVLSRDANGQGSVTPSPSVFKSVLLVDLSVGTPTNFAGTSRDNLGATVTSAVGVLDPAITPLSSTEAVNMLNSDQLGKFNIDLDLGGGTQVTKRTLGEKWEGMSLVPANDPAAPNDYFLFIANDNDFLTSQGKMVGPAGTLVNYNAFSAHPAARLPAPVAPSTNNENDTMFLAFRVTINPAADKAPVAAPSAPVNHPPVVAVSGKKKITTAAATFKVHGKAVDSDGSVRVVEVKVNKGSYRKAKGSAKWSFAADLKPGKNVILVRSIDASGAVSAPQKIIVFKK
jgi:hypothetical protein